MCEIYTIRIIYNIIVSSNYIMEKSLKKILKRLKNYQKNASGVQHNQFVIELPYIQEFIKIHINNLGDPFFVPKIPLDPHTFPEEREIIRKFDKNKQMEKGSTKNKLISRK